MADERSNAAEFTRFHSQNAKRTFILKIAVWLIVLLLLAVAAFFFARNLFSVKTIVVDGTEHYTFTQITKAGGLSEGQFIFFVSEDKLTERLTERFAYIRSVEVEKQYPNTVTVKLEEEEPEFYFEMQGEYFLLTRSLRVLERFTDPEKLRESAPNARYIQIPDVSRAVVCETLEFAQASKSRHTDEALAMLADSRLYSGVTEIDFSNRFEMKIVYENRLEVHLGSFEDFAYKLDLAIGMIHAYSEQATGKLEIVYDSDGDLKGVATVTDSAAP